MICISCDHTPKNVPMYPSSMIKIIHTLIIPEKLAQMQWFVTMPFTSP